MKNKIFIKIADIVICLKSDTKIVLEEGFNNFIIQQELKYFDVEISCHNDLERISIPNSSMVFEGSNEEQINYKIHRPNGKINHLDFEAALIFEIFNQNEKGKLQKIAFTNRNFTRWQIHSNDESGAIQPLEFPMGPIMYNYICQNFNAVMIHASCINDNGKGRLFSGFSGTGKSTMSEIWKKEGHQIINDDRLIIRKTSEGFFVFNTPMYYTDDYKSVKLESVYLIRHSPVNQIQQLNGAFAITRMLAFCIQNNFEAEMIRKNLNLIKEINAQANIYDLGVVPTKEIIEFIQCNE